MLKRLSAITAVLMLLLLPSTVWAHSGLEQANPGENETIEGEIREITLDFDTTIEPLSTFELIHESGEKIEGIDIRVDGDRLIGTLNGSLANGNYTVHWKIVGEDGHPVEGEYVFHVNVQENPPETTPTAPQTESNDTPVTNDEPVDADVDTTQEGVASTEGEGTAGKSEEEGVWSPLTLAIVSTVLGIIILIGYELGRQRKS